MSSTDQAESFDEKDMALLTARKRLAEEKARADRFEALASERMHRIMYFVGQRAELDHELRTAKANAANAKRFVDTQWANICAVAKKHKLLRHERDNALDAIGARLKEFSAMERGRAKEAARFRREVAALTDSEAKVLAHAEQMEKERDAAQGELSRIKDATPEAAAEIRRAHDTVQAGYKTHGGQVRDGHDAHLARGLLLDVMARQAAIIDELRAQPARSMDARLAAELATARSEIAKLTKRIHEIAAERNAAFESATVEKFAMQEKLGELTMAAKRHDSDMRASENWHKSQIAKLKADHAEDLKRRLAAQQGDLKYIGSDGEALKVAEAEVVRIKDVAQSLRDNLDIMRADAAQVRRAMETREQQHWAEHNRVAAERDRYKHDAESQQQRR